MSTVEHEKTVKILKIIKECADIMMETKFDQTQLICINNAFSMANNHISKKLVETTKD